MEWIMTVAAGAAIGYFLYQFIAKGGNSGSGNARRLHKSTRDKKLAGVCGGIAETLNVDSTIIRLVTVLLFFGWGSGLLAYIICALIMPEGTPEQES